VTDSLLKPTKTCIDYNKYRPAVINWGNVDQEQILAAFVQTRHRYPERWKHAPVRKHNKHTLELVRKYIETNNKSICKCRIKANRIYVGRKIKTSKTYLIKALKKVRKLRTPNSKRTHFRSTYRVK